MTLVEQLQEVIRQKYGCSATWVDSTFVREERNGQLFWEGHVHAFTLLGHQKARQCYAWQHGGLLDEPRFVAIIAIDQVDSACAAVRAAMVNESRRQGH